MNQIKSESLSAIDENIDKRPANDQSERFVRRLNKYRIHQSDCRTKNDQSFREFCDHENDHTRKLQEQATIEVKSRKKAYRRQSSKKNKVRQIKSILNWIVQNFTFSAKRRHHRNKFQQMQPTTLLTSITLKC